jgi:hypothetical protein
MAGAALDLSLDVGARPQGTGGKVSLDLVAAASLDIPGIRLSVEKLRASLLLGLELADGTVRVAPPTLEPPELTRMGAELDLAIFSGGGYLAHAEDEWRGALAAHLGPLSVSGFGILETEQFSILILLAAEFFPGIQLSLGFTLAGVGGLVGINRRPDTPALQSAVSSGDLSKLLFPHDPIAEADHLLAVLSGCFPHADGGFVVGPMVKIGWGTPTLAAATIGVLVSDSGVVIIGRIAITLPFEQAALIRLEAFVLGTIDADGFAIAASLANSQIVGLPIEGDMRLHIRGGSKALFVFSAGGFHPAFVPPDAGAPMRRIGTHISPGAILQARLEAYLAVTTGSVQFGAHADVAIGVDGFGVKGYLNFDSLILLDPFGFMVDFSAGVSVECADFSVGSIDLAGHMAGPSPWRIRGYASFSVLWWDIDIDIPEITWGSPEPGPLPAARDPLGVLLRELAVAANWTATSANVAHLVQLQPAVEHQTAAVHPLAELGFRQNAVPLDTELRRMDGVPLGLATTLRVQVRTNGTTAAPTPVQEQFAPGQFLDLDDKAKLASAGYAQLDGGFDLAATGFMHGPGDAERKVTYETAVLGEDLLLSLLPSEILGTLLAAVGHDAAPRVRDAGRFVSLRDPGASVVVDTKALGDKHAQLVEGLAGVAASTGNLALAASTERLQATAELHPGQAEALVSQLRSSDPTAAAGLQVVRAWELVGA